MTGLQALNAVESVVSAVQNVKTQAAAVPAGPKAVEARGRVNALAYKLLQLEQAAQSVFAQAVPGPWPVPDARNVFGWVGELGRAGTLRSHLIRVVVPDEIGAASRMLLEESGALGAWIRDTPNVAAAPVSMPPPPMPGPMGAPLGVPIGGPMVAPGAGGVTNRGIGLVMVAAAGVMETIGFLRARKAQKERRAMGLELDDDENPAVIRQHAQTALDAEIPGATVSLSPSPSGVWIASVKSGSKRVALAKSKKAKDAAGEAVSAALAWDEARTVDVEADVLDGARDVTPPKKRREAQEEAEATA